MPDLAQSLQGRDLGHLRIVAELWGVEFDAPDARIGLQRLAPLLLARGRVAEVIAELSDEARAALADLIQHDGRLPWGLFTRRYGSVREVGPARRDREQPYRKPVSPAEALWYRALYARAFFDAATGPEEFAYIPDDLLALIPAPEGGAAASLGRPATPAERAHPIPAVDHLLDDATSLLAALRTGERGYPEPAIPLQALLAAAGLLDPAGLPLPDPTRAFLESCRGEALAQLTRAWLNSATIDELRLLPGLRCEGGWQNDPLRARRAVLDFLSTVPNDKWWSLPAFVADIRQRHPDFQRPAGDYDTWFIRSEQTGDYLRGFEHWEAVDGALIRSIITGPLHWLGVLDLSTPGPDALTITAFRYSAWGEALLQGRAPAGLSKEEETLQIQSDGRVRVPRLAPRAAHYQIARFCERETGQTAAARYRLTPAALARARQQGLSTVHLLALLRRYAEAIPPSLVKALERWEQHGAEARIEPVWVLRLSSPELLKTLRASRVARFLGEPLSPTVVIIQPGAAQKVLQALAEMGYLGEASLDAGE
jgi:hypothetical protein